MKSFLAKHGVTAYEELKFWEIKYISQGKKTWILINVLKSNPNCQGIHSQPKRRDLLFQQRHRWVYWTLQRLALVLFRNSRSQIFAKYYISEVKIGVLKNFAIFTGKHLCWSLFFNKVLQLKSATLLKGDSNAGVLLWILWNFSKHLFWRTSANDCFCL